MQKDLIQKFNFHQSLELALNFGLNWKQEKISKYENQKHVKLVRCKTMDKDDLIVFKKYNFTYSKNSMMSQIKHYSLERSKSDPNIEYEQIESKSSRSLQEFSQFKHDELDSENFKQTNMKDLNQVIQLKRERTRKLNYKNEKYNNKIDFEKEFEYSPIPSNENIWPVNDIPSFVNRAADLTGKGFIKAKIIEIVNRFSFY